MSIQMTRFGPAGNEKAFYEMHKNSYEMPQYLSKLGLDWYEYSCGRGANIKEETAKKIGQYAKEYNIGMSIHAPYYINFANQDPQMQEKSRQYIYQTLGVAKNMQAQRIVFHPGSCSKIDRDIALNTALDSIKILLKEVDNANLGDIIICPETMGKRNQLGNLKEVLAICSLDERMLPTIDFGHLNARRCGSIKDESDYCNILDSIQNKLGYDRMSKMHVHFSHIEYTKMGEKKHLTNEDDVYGPYFLPFAKQLVKRRMQAVIICESKNVMAHDALEMQQIYHSLI